LFLIFTMLFNFITIGRFSSKKYTSFESIMLFSLGMSFREVWILGSWTSPCIYSTNLFFFRDKLII
jgi:hypothetical protein